MTVAKNEHTSSRRKNHRSDSNEAAPTESSNAMEPEMESAAQAEASSESTSEAPESIEAATPEAASPEAAMSEATTSETPAGETPVAEASETPEASAEMAEAPTETPPLQGRDRIQQQLEQLKQREAELRRELAMADHPGLADAIRQIEGRAYGVARVEAKMAQGLSKSELRKKETIEKKLSTAKERRAEIDAQIAALELELAPLGEERVLAFQKERAEALLRLVSLLGEHEAAIAAANLDLGLLVPALAAWRTEIEALRSMA